MSLPSNRLLSFLFDKSRDFSIKVNLILWFEGYVHLLFSWLPGVEGFLIRNFFYKLIFKRIGRACYIMPNFSFTHSYNIELGNGVGINSGCNFAGRGGLKVGDNAQFGQNVVVITSGHNFQDPSRFIIDQGHTDGFVEIEKDVWVGANAVILPKVKLSEGTVVGAGSVVTKDTEPFSIVAGVPAKKIGQRETEV